MQNQNRKTNRQDTSRKDRKHSTHDLVKHGRSYFDVWTIIPLSLSILLMVSIWFVFFSKNHTLKFCENNFQKECIPCPFNGICTDGKLKCKFGYKVKNNECVPDSVRQQKISHFIASQISDSCQESIPIDTPTLYEEFGKSEFFESALQFVTQSKYDINFNGKYYISYKPIQSLKCKVMSVAEANRLSVVLMCICLLLITIFIISIQHKKRIQNMIHTQANRIINQLAAENNGSFVYESNFANNKNASKNYWQKVTREVERNNSVITLNGKQGKMWKICDEQ